MSKIKPTKTGFKVKKVGVESLDKFNDSFDDSFEDGVFTESRDVHKPRTKPRPLLKYCQDHGKTPSQLTEEELKLFTI